MTEEKEDIVNTPDIEKEELTAGEMLRNARSQGRRKREIQTVAKQLCIKEEFLQALEDGNYTFIPEVVYILGFARNYAIELGLDPDEIVAKIKQEMGISQDAMTAPAEEDVVRTKGGEKFMKVTLFERVRDFIVPHWKLVAGGLLALVVILIVALVLYGGRGGAEVAAGEDAIVVTSTVAEPPYKHAVRERFGVENRETAQVVLQATAESWVKIEDARGNTVFSRVLVPGDVYFVPAGDKYKGTFGNAGGVDAWVGGELAPALGEDHTRVNAISMAPGSLMKNTPKKEDSSDSASDNAE